ncbi:PLP-dependent aminotransferase family protein [Paenarthrobacter sp. PH39-S1]|uniref:aminotransferase-like domain-containing protein n=1 Tax=Paenarthrobacter sp. PH39-S1 TaxID=3046204 RepID=UPI0024B91C11|nr:PLP-dependent aminotransferase family protein [Paenarthrobacter sp. PH39-S1]MDJ0357933.1 PLP-dependent aminotransferase family protein [Paenarthrobacter sp. PH39-S1]
MTITTDSLHTARFADRADGYHPSPVREVFEVSMQPNMISLAGGNPDLSGLPLDRIADMAQRIIKDRGEEALQYGSGAGTPELQELICEIMALEGISALPENVQITSGSQMALELVTKLFCNPHDVILAEGPTYVGALGTFEGLQADVVQVAIDEKGLIPSELQDAIRALKAQSRTIKFLYTIPNFNNPSGISLTPERRQEIVDICRTEGIAIVEDNPYGLLSFDGSARAALHSLDPDNVFYLGSFSKIFSPGLRIGWVLAPTEVRKRLQLAAEATTICPSVLSQMLVESYVSGFDWRAHVRDACTTYARRCDAVMEALELHMPEGTTWTRPTGGFFTWITLPAGRSVDALLQPAIDGGVVFVPGSAFFAEPAGANQLRVAFSFETEEALVEGVRRLGAAVAALPG